MVSQEDARNFAGAEVSVLTIELVETGLIDEGLIEVWNGLVAAGVVTPETRCIPGGYATYLQFGYAEPGSTASRWTPSGTTGATTTTTPAPGSPAGSFRWVIDS